MPRDASLVAVVRDGHVVVPRGDTMLQVGDEVLALVTNDAETTNSRSCSPRPAKLYAGR